MENASADAQQPANTATDGGNPLTQVPIEVLVSVGKAHPLIGDLLELKNNSVLPLNQKVSDPVELYVGNKLIAKGELQELDGDTQGRLAVRLTEVAVQGDRI
jgi:flagellar motor switch protein FliN/FliY